MKNQHNAALGSMVFY